MDKVIERYAQVRAIREKDPERFPKLIFGPFNMGHEIGRGFAVYETYNPDQLHNIALHFVPVMTFRFVPILESARAVELYQKMKKQPESSPEQHDPFSSSFNRAIVDTLLFIS